MRISSFSSWSPLLLALLIAGCASSGATSDDDAEPEAADSTAIGRAPLPPVEVPRTIPTTRPPAAPTAADTVTAGRFDSGKMWTFDNPPREYLQEAYGFTADDEWFEQARLGALRIPGCSASFVSPYGLVLTNHHCARNYIVQVGRPGENLLDDGFFAASLDEERPVEGLYAEQLIEIRDVTERLEVAADAAQTDAERADARTTAAGEVEAEILASLGGEGAGFAVQVIDFYSGGRTSAYVFRRYQDVRLVMAPEFQLGYYGGDEDNFTYPRFALDATFLRVYDDEGAPLEPEAYFPFSADPLLPGDLIFIVGNPGSTNRLETVAQLEFRRDVQERYLLDLLRNRISALQLAVREVPDDDALRNRLFSLLNAEKAYAGRLEALRDPVIMARRAAAERTFQDAIDEDASLRASYGDLVDAMAELQRERRALAAPTGAFLSFRPGSGLTSTTLGRALIAYEALRPGGPGLDAEDVRAALLNLPDQPKTVETLFMAGRIDNFVRFLGDGVEEGLAAIPGGTPAEQAASVFENSALSSAPRLEEALDEGTLTVEDPALRVLAVVWDARADYLSAAAGLDARQQEVARQLGRARLDVYGDEVPPDATFSLRINDGIVQGYEYNGTVAPPFSTFYGLYDHYYSYGPGTPWDLPERWLSPPETFDPSTPLNFVTTNDIIGGNSGSPLLNRDLEVVGLAFDGNIESLLFAFIYLTDRARTVGVDARGILEALDDIYDMDRLVLELTVGTLAETEEAADLALGQS